MAQARPADHDRDHDITDLRGAALGPRLVLLRRPRHRHPAAHRHQVGRRRLLGPRGPAAHRPRGRAGRPGRPHPLRRLRRRRLPRRLGAAAGPAGPDPRGAGAARGRRGIDRAARRRRDRPGQRLPVVVRRPRRGVGLPVGPARDRRRGVVRVHRSRGRPVLHPPSQPVPPAAPTPARPRRAGAHAGPGGTRQAAAGDRGRPASAPAAWGPQVGERAGAWGAAGRRSRPPSPPGAASLRRAADDPRRDRAGDGRVRRHAVAGRPLGFPATTT